jgi:diguanylate cyclase (GGDEF)-like protein
VRARIPRLSLLGRFSLLSLALFVLLGGVLGVVLQSSIKRRAIADARRLGVVLARGAGASLRPGDVRAPVAGADLRRLDQSLREPLAGSGVARVKLFEPGGVVVYSDDHALIGSREGDDMDAVVRGGVRTGITRGTVDRDRGPRMLQVYVPLHVQGSRLVDAVFELYLPYAPVARSIARDTRTLAIVLAAGLALLWAALFRIVATASRKLRRQALQDELTGLANRARLHSVGTRALAAAAREDRLAALLLVDLDRFKEVNDTLGHDQGDALLREVAERLGRAIRRDDLLARLGGDEFAVLLKDLPHRGAAAELAARLRETLGRPFLVAGVAVELDASIGIALHPEHGIDTTTLLQRADVAMYEAKRERAGIAVYAAGRDPYSPERLALIAELRQAVERDELVLHFQPKVAIGSGALSGVEALVRWQHPERGLLPPFDFLPLAERTGVIADVTRWVLDAALRQSRAWLDAGVRLPIAVNLSAADVLDARLPEVVAAALARWQVPGELLECEISEHTVLADPLRAVEGLSRLRAMGIRLSLDDFGRGQSSLAYLKRLPLDEIKIDRSFVMGMTRDGSDAAIVRATIDLGRHLGLLVVAEGVESDEVLAELAGLSCDEAQGFGIGRPMPGHELADWLAIRGAAAGTASAAGAASARPQYS